MPLSYPTVKVVELMRATLSFIKDPMFQVPHGKSFGRFTVPLSVMSAAAAAAIVKDFQHLGDASLAEPNPGHIAH